MDFSALNPLSTNVVSLAAGKNDIVTLRHLLDSGKNPNCNDNRGWTSLHVSAANDAFDAVQVLLDFPTTIALAETFEGHTALYLACRNKCSMRTINLLLQHGENVAEYASNEMVSPLHVVCCQGRMDAAEALIAAGSLINLQDYDGDSPLHEAARRGHAELSSALLHAGADPSLRNTYGLSPFLLSCFRGAIDCVQAIFPFVLDVNECAHDGNTGLILAAQRGALEVAMFLLENNANPDLENDDGDLPLYMALVSGHAQLFKLLLPVTNMQKMKRDLMNLACKPLYFSMDILTTLLESDLGPAFFNNYERFYVTLEKIFDFRPEYVVNPPFCSILNVIEYIYKSSKDLCQTLVFLLLTKGVNVNPLYKRECPPLVYLHYTEHVHCHSQVIDILISQDCDVDYSTMKANESDLIVPDAIIASITSGGYTLPILLTYSLKLEPEQLVEKLAEYNFIGQRISAEVMLRILPMCCLSPKVLEALRKQLVVYLHTELDSGSSELSDLLMLKVPPLKHLTRKVIRSRLRPNAPTTKQFLWVLKELPLPVMLKLYLRYL